MEKLSEPVNISPEDSQIVEAIMRQIRNGELTSDDTIRAAIAGQIFSSAEAADYIAGRIIDLKNAGALNTPEPLTIKMTLKNTDTQRLY